MSNNNSTQTARASSSVPHDQAPQTQTPPNQHQHPPSHTAAPSSAARPSRVRLVDRLALQLGLALITWSRRSRNPDSWERRATRVEQQRSREARELAALRLALRTAPPR